MVNTRQSNVIDDLATYEDNFFNVVFSDPPYALGSKVFVDTDGRMKYKGKAKDFMDKWTFSHEDWEVFFEESFRTLKHGGFCVLYGMDRQQPLIQYYAIRAGFEVQQSLYWYFISSFPKAADLSKNIDKREGAEREVVGTKFYGPDGKERTGGRLSSNYSSGDYGEYNTTPTITASATDLAQKYDGYKYSVSPFKQVVETIMVFKKPTKNSSVLDDVYAYEEGDKTIHPAVINIDGGRVGMEQVTSLPSNNKNNHHYAQDKWTKNELIGEKKTHQGRYPSQMFLDEYCADRIDEQSGFLKSGDLTGQPRGENKIYGSAANTLGTPRYHMGDSGGASRINHIIPWTEEEMDLLYYAPKVSGRERNAGLAEFEEKLFARSGGARKAEKEGSEEYLQDHMGLNKITKVKNNHPTLKPLSLNFKIFELFKVPDLDDMKVYVPFAGTFSEVIGVLANGVKEENVYACELSQEYIEVGEARLAYWRENQYDFKNLPTTRTETSSKKKKDDAAGSNVLY